MSSTNDLGPAPTTPTTARRLTALDGLRGLAVAGVVLFHAFPSWLPGGFAGVDVFFVLSGYLITTGLVRDAEDGRLHLGRFWGRRARRLLPALALLILVCGTVVGMTGGDAAVGFGGQVLAAIGFATNWRLIAIGNSYFAQASPPVFQHLWSLAVEEQFYLLWPLALIAMLLLSRRPRTPAKVASWLALASMAGMIVAAFAASTGRAYYGTDTHAFGLLGGAALALALPTLPAPSRLLAWLGTPVALAGLLVSFRVLDGDARLTYVIGLPLVVALTLAIVVGVQQASPVSWLLGLRPLTALGRISYGLYLWHWPALVVLQDRFSRWDASHPGQVGWTAIALSLVAATLSYLLLEHPVLSGGLWRYLATAWRLARGTGAPRAAVSGVGLGLVGCLAATVIAVLHAPAHTAAENQILAGEQAIARVRLAGQATTPSPDPAPPTSLPRHAPSSGSSSGSSSSPTTGPVPLGRRITAVGDSVMLASAQGLLHRFPGIDIDAVVGRQAWSMPAVLRADARHGRLRPIVLVGMGTNGYLGDDTLAELRRIVGPKRTLLLVNVYADRAWAGPDDHALATFVAHDPHARLVDWRGAICHHLGDLGPDHIHPGPAGGRLYAATVAATLKRALKHPSGASRAL